MMLAQLARQPAVVARHRPAHALSVPARVGIDLGLVALSCWLAYLLRYRWGWGGAVAGDDQRPFASFAPIVALLDGLVLAVFAQRGVYRLSRWTSLLDEARLVLGGTVTAFATLIVLVFYSRQLDFSRLVLLYALVIGGTLLVGARVLGRRWQARRRALRRHVDRVLVVGAGQAGERVMSALLDQPALGYDVLGYVDDRRPSDQFAVATQRHLVRPAHLGTFPDLPALLAAGQIDEVIIALPHAAHERLREAIALCRQRQVPFTLLPDLFDLSLEHCQVHQLHGLPLISVRDGRIRGWNAVLKRGFDLAFAALALGLFALPMLLIAALIRLDSPGPILYRQRRIGRDGAPFTCLKFRSMYHNADQDKGRLASNPAYTGDRVMFKLKDDPRRTRVGRWLRRTSLDELPNFINVLLGEMSVVGPRPHLPDEVARYEPWQRRRLALKPGITCLWQVNGRSHLTFAEQTRLDLYYAEHWSLWLDITIVLRTVPAVLTARGAY